MPFYLLVLIQDGVLNIQFGAPYGSYVINRQRPNLQIWLSSPTSGPKRYDFMGGRWIYKHDGVCLHDLLEKETSEILKQSVDLSGCAFYKL
jgi:frataxin